MLFKCPSLTRNIYVISFGFWSKTWSPLLDTYFTDKETEVWGLETWGVSYSTFYCNCPCWGALVVRAQEDITLGFNRHPWRGITRPFACGHSARWRPFQSQLSQSYHPWFVSTVAQLAEAQEFWFPWLQGHWRPWPISLDQNSSHKSPGNLQCCGKCRKSRSRKSYPSHMPVFTLGIWMDWRFWLHGDHQSWDKNSSLM